MDSDNRGPELQRVVCALLTLAILTTLTRTYTRIAIVKQFGFDDACMIAAAISFTLFVTCALVGIHYGTGRHWWTLDEENIEKAMKFWWLCYLWYCTSMIASKISIGVFLLRITVRTIDIFIIYGVMIITVLTGIVFFFITLFQCWPVEFFWDKNIPGGTCIDINAIINVTYVYSAFSVICDFTFALLPLFLIWRLNMKTSVKVGLVPIMAMACVASTAVVVRFAYVKDFKNPDFLYATVDIAIWSTAEQGLAITAGSLATLRPLLRSISETLNLSSSSRQLHDPTSDQRQNHGLRTFSKLSNGTPKEVTPTLTTFLPRKGADDDRGAHYSLETGAISWHDSQTTDKLAGGKKSPIWPISDRSSHGDNGSEEGLHVAGNMAST